MSRTRCRKKSSAQRTTRIFSANRLRLDSRNVRSVKRVVMASHQWFCGCLNLLLVCLVGLFQLMLNKHTSVFMALTGPIECCLSSFSCDTSFQRCFTCAFFPSTHTVFTTNFPLLVPSHTQFDSLTYSSSLRAGQTTTHIFITYYREKKIFNFLKKGIKFM